MADPRDEQDRDPLWEAAFWLVFVDALGFLFFHAFTGRPLFDPWDTLFFMPLMVLGLARGIRNDGGNVTQHVRAVLRGKAVPSQRYTPGFAAYILFIYGFVIAMVLAAHGPATSSLTVIAVQGAGTAYVLYRVLLQRSRKPRESTR